MDLKNTESALSSASQANTGLTLQELEGKVQKINEQAKRIDSLLSMSSDSVWILCHTSRLSGSVARTIPTCIWARSRLF